MDVQALIRPLERLEKGMELFYDGAAARFAREDAHASQVFARLAFEERSHLTRLAYLRRFMRQRAEPLKDADANRRVLDEELGFLDDAQARLPRMTLSEAIAAALKVEYGAGECHGRLAIATANPEVATVLVGLKDADEQHGKRLVALALDRGVYPTPPLEPS